MRLIKKVRQAIVKKRVVSKTNTKEQPLNKKYTLANKSHIVITPESKKLFSENKTFLKSLLLLSQEIGQITEKVTRKYTDPSGRFSLNLVNRNKIFSLGTKSTNAIYSLSIKNKEYSVIINSFNISKLGPKGSSQAVISSLKSDIALKSNIQVISPIYGLSTKKSKTNNTDKTIMIYPSLSNLTSANSKALSFKMQEALKEVVKKLNKTIEKTIKENHSQLKVSKDSVFKFDISDFYVDSKTKRIYAVF
jgi:hypothetical protein